LVHVPREAEDQPAAAVRSRVELKEGAGLDRLHGVFVPLRVPPIRMAAREDELEQLVLRTLARGLPVPTDVREDLVPDALHLLRGHDGRAQAVREDREHLPRHATRRAPPEPEEVLRDVELEGGPEALEGLREAAGVPSLRAAQQQTGEELRNPVLGGTFGRDSGGEAPLERDEGTGGVRKV